MNRASKVAGELRAARAKDPLPPGYGVVHGGQMKTLDGQHAALGVVVAGVERWSLPFIAGLSGGALCRKNGARGSACRAPAPADASMI